MNRYNSASEEESPLQIVSGIIGLIGLLSLMYVLAVLMLSAPCGD